MLIGGVALTILGLALLIPALRGWVRLHQLRRSGRRVTGEIVDVDLHDFYSFTPTRPIARYEFDGHSHEVVIGNWTGKAALHTGIELLVDSDAPSEAFAEHGNAAASAVLTYSVVVVVGLAVCVLVR